MDKRVFLLGIVLFSLGWTLNGVYVYFSEQAIYNMYECTESRQLVTEGTSGENVEMLQTPEESNDIRDVPSPSSRIMMEDINVYDDEVVLRIKNPQWAVFTDTNSMDPVIDSTSKAIEVVPSSENDIHVGDIVAYNSKYADGIVAHRVIETGYDDFGWYARMKGDNNPNPDPEKVRMQQIISVVAAIIY